MTRGDFMKSKKQIVLIVLMSVCTVILATSTYYLTESLVTLFQALNETPEMNISITRAIRINIFFHISVLLFYGLFIWLAISTVKQCRRHPKSDK